MAGTARQSSGTGLRGGRAGGLSEQTRDTGWFFDWVLVIGVLGGYWLKMEIGELLAQGFIIRRAGQLLFSRPWYVDIIIIVLLLTWAALIRLRRFWERRRRLVGVVRFILVVGFICYVALAFWSLGSIYQGSPPRRAGNQGTATDFNGADE